MACSGFTSYAIGQACEMRKKAQRRNRNRVTAVFQSAAVSIELARRTSFAELAEHLDALGEIYGKLVHPVHVRLGDSRSCISGTRV
jgi:hypothetical protein